jgi:ketosteroid isomerase-like protein
MSASPTELALKLLEALSAKDGDAALAVLDENVTLYDPHYPTPLMTGHAAIRSANEYAFGLFKQMRWTVLRAWENENSAVIEADTAHELPDGSLVTPKQVFVVDVANDKITNWRTYVPYPPPA